MIFLVCLEMLCEVRNAFAKNSNLDFRRTRVRSVNLCCVMMLPLVSLVRLMHSDSAFF
jgi:hypothetical protein